MSIRDGLLRIRGLQRGDYDLWIKPTNQRIRLRIADGDADLLADSIEKISVQGRKCIGFNAEHVQCAKNGATNDDRRPQV